MKPKAAFTLVELLAVIGVVGILSALVMVAVGESRFSAMKAESASNIRQLATAAELYASEHGAYPPWGNLANNIRWHGKRSYEGFTGRDGYLSPYLAGGEVRFCPVLRALLGDDPQGFDLGAGGYGYNSAYVGRNPRAPGGGYGQGSPRAYVTNPTQTVLFTSTAIATGEQLSETDETVPPRVVRSGGLGESHTPTTHFRFRGKALVAWADGHVTLESPNDAIDNGQNPYNGDNDEFSIGWFGPEEYNGFWNPRYSYGQAY